MSKSAFVLLAAFFLFGAPAAIETRAAAFAITDNLTINGSGGGINANGASRVFNVQRAGNG